MLLQSLASTLQLDKQQPLSDIQAAATSALGARPIITCDYSHGTAYFDSVSHADEAWKITCAPAVSGKSQMMTKESSAGVCLRQ